MNTGEPAHESRSDLFPEREEAEWRVLRIQKKLHRWAAADPGLRFDDLANLVYDPALLVVAWHRVRGNKGARTAGVDGVTPRGLPARQPEPPPQSQRTGVFRVTAAAPQRR